MTLDRHIFTTEEYISLLENLRREGFAAGTRAAKQDMGEALDRITRDMHQGAHYRFPYWSGFRPAVLNGESIAFERPVVVEFSREQLEAVRFLLCGPH